MKYLFILNQQAGNARATAKLEAELRAMREAQGLNYDLCPTSTPEEAAHAIRHACGGGGEVCVVACGGDGTFSGTVNVTAEFPGAVVALMPVGTGNDFIRNFADREIFLDPVALQEGRTVELDLLRCGDRLCTNMVNIGFDCEAARQAAILRRNPIMGEKLAYISGVALTLIRKPGVTVTARMDDEPSEEHRLLLTAIANGAFCGGGFRAAPKSHLDDGLMDVCMVNNVSRTKFLTLAGSYREGTYLEKKSAHGVFNYRKCRRLELQFPGMQNICVDGDIMESDHLTVEVLPRAMRFVLPRGAVWEEAEVLDPVGTL